MPTDYKSLGDVPEKKPLPGFVWLAGGLVIGLFVALLVYLDKQPENPVNFKEAVQAELDRLKKNAGSADLALKNTTTKSDPETIDSTSSRPAKLDSQKNTATNEPKFNFYTILPELEVFIPDIELKPSSNTAEKQHSAKEDKSYILQAGSFKNLNDADRLKASLALLGMEATLQSVTVNAQQWHRVRTGPYNNTKDLYQSLNLLKQNGVNAMPLEIKPNE